ncbi:MAG: TonB family protein [Terriglobales bacterium]
MIKFASMPLGIRAFCVTILLLTVSLSVYPRAQVSQGSKPAGKSATAPKEDVKVIPPHAVYDPNPQYTQEARRAGHQGTCILSFTVGTDGLPRDIKMVRGVGTELDDLAVATVRTWRFEPARKDGKPVEAQIKTQVKFRLHGGSADKMAKLWDRSDKSDPKADLELSKAYFEGRGVPQDEPLGFQFLTTAANWNLPEAQFLMGERFYKSQSGSPDYAAAYMWYALSKRGGYKKGEEMLRILAPKMSAEQLTEAETRIDYWPEAPPK